MRQSRLEEIKGRFITREGLDNLSQYKYSGEDLSIIYNYAVQPFAKALCKITPRIIAPNVLTLLGALCSVASYLIMAYHVPHFNEAADRWVYFVCSLLVFLYMMLDAMDGTQARRTKMAGPIGELFDHLCDSLSMSLCVLIFAASTRMGPITTYVALLATYFPFYFSHWADFNTGKLVMGKFGGPTDLLVGLSLLLLLTGCTGSGIWVHELFKIQSYSISANLILCAAVIVGAVVSTCQYILAVAKCDEVTLSWPQLIRQLTAFFTFWITCLLWGIVSTFMIRSHSHQFMVAIGFIYAYLLARIIVQRVTKESLTHFHIIFVPFFLCIFISFLTYHSLVHLGNWRLSDHQSEITIEGILYGLLGFALLQWIYFFGTVVRQLAAELHMTVFTVPKEKRQAASETSPLLQDHSHDQSHAPSSSSARNSYEKNGKHEEKGRTSPTGYAAV